MSIRHGLILAFTLLLLTVSAEDVFAQPGRQFGPPPQQQQQNNSPLGGLCCLGIAFLVPLVLAIWVFNDAASYGMSQIGWAALVFFFGLIGLVIYLVVRSSAAQPRRRSYDDEDDYDDRPRRPRRRRPRDADDDEPRRRREDWERDADY